MGELLAARRARFWHALGSQLAHPRGRAGWLTGIAMGVANRRPNRLVIEALEAGPDDSVLDIGCGPGHALALVARRCREAHGVDRSEVMVRQARRRNRRRLRLDRTAIVQGDFAQLPYPDARFDRIMASNVLYFWADVGAVLRELRRVLRPGGRIVIYVTDRASMETWPFAASGTHRTFGPDDLRRQLAGAAGDAMSLRIAEVALPGRITGLLAVLDDRPRPAAYASDCQSSKPRSEPTALQASRSARMDSAL